MTGLHREQQGVNLHQPFHYEQEGDPGAVGAAKYWFKPSTGALARRNALNTAWTVINGVGVVAPTTRWEPLTNGDPATPEILFDAEGDVVMVEVPL